MSHLNFIKYSYLFRINGVEMFKLDMIVLEVTGLDMIRLDTIVLEVTGLEIIGLEMTGSQVKHNLL